MDDIGLVNGRVSAEWIAGGGLRIFGYRTDSKERVSFVMTAADALDIIKWALRSVKLVKDNG